MTEFERWILSTLNEEQAQAVRQPHDATVIVHAGAGTGKTRLLSTRIAWLASGERAVGLNRIAALTFTVKAAKEMSDRLLRVLLGRDATQRPEGAPWPMMGTFHGDLGEAAEASCRERGGDRGTAPDRALHRARRRRAGAGDPPSRARHPVGKSGATRHATRCQACANRRPGTGAHGAQGSQRTRAGRRARRTRDPSALHRAETSTQDPRGQGGGARADRDVERGGRGLRGRARGTRRRRRPRLLGIQGTSGRRGLHRSGAMGSQAPA